MNMNAGGRKVSSESLLWADLIECDMKKWVWYQTFLNQVNSGEDGDSQWHSGTCKRTADSEGHLDLTPAKTTIYPLMRLSYTIKHVLTLY